MPGTPHESPNASSVSQGLALLHAAVARERSGRQGHNLTRLAEATGVEPSRASRLTQELRELGYLERRDSAVLTAGSRYLRVAGSLNVPWLRTVRGPLRELASGLRVNALIAVADGPGALLLRHEVGVGATDAALRAGMATPIWCTASGRALLWDHSLDRLDQLLRPVTFVGIGGPAAARSVGEVHDLLVRDRQDGIVAAREEYVEGVDQFALPIRDAGGIVASVAVSGPRRGAAFERRARAALERLVAELGTVPAGR